MNKFIDNILKETEDSSDDFFQSKHVEKRKEDFKKQEEIKRKIMLKKRKKHFQSYYKE